MPWSLHFHPEDAINALFDITSRKLHADVSISARSKALRHGCLVSSIKL
jgi:hypothetical protein